MTFHGQKAYADDGMLWVTGAHVPTMCDRLDYVLADLHEWARTHDYAISPKSTAMLAGHDPSTGTQNTGM
jgi:hypothetical protein